MGAPYRLKLGRQIERRAISLLRQRGLELLERNFRTRFGEIDLVMRDSDCLVIVEVRYRSGRSLVSAADSVDRAKQRKLTLAAASYLQRHPRFAHRPVRFDVVAFDEGFDGRPVCRWIRDAFRPED